MYFKCPLIITNIVADPQGIARIVQPSGDRTWFYFANSDDFILHDWRNL